MSKIKVAIYSGVIPSTTFIENLITSVVSENVEVLIFGNQRKKINYKHPNISIHSSPDFNWRVIPFVIYNMFALIFTSASRYKLLKKFINQGNPGFRLRLFLWSKYLPIIINLPDIFHIQWVKSCDEWIFLKEIFNVKLIASFRGAQINYKPLADPALAEKYRKLFPVIDGFHAVSKDIAQTAIPYGAAPSKTRIIYTGINFDNLNKFQKPAINNITKKINIISVGRMHWKKGYHFALDALKVLDEKGFDFHYTIIAGLNAEEILYQVEDIGLKEKVSLYKSMPQQEVFSHMQKSDLFLLSSFEEGVANVALEAMAIGLPVLSSDCGGMPEVVFHKQTGYLYKKREINDLVRKLEDFISEDYNKKNLVIDNARAFVKQNHTLNNLGNNMRNFYTDVMNDTK